MFKSRTVFVIGAGASKEFGFPLGADLTAQIASSLNFRFEHGQYSGGGDGTILDAIRRSEGALHDTNGRLRAASIHIREAMPISPSIDNYMEAHSTSTEIAVVAKIAIASEIVRAEANSRLKVNRDYPWRLRFDNLGDNWIRRLFIRLVEGVKKADIKNILANVSFIIFNYDRCVEQFLFYALQAYYQIPDTTAADILNSVTFIHPYGAVGRLPWQVCTDETATVEFGEDVGADKLIHSSSSLVTFAESQASARKGEIAQLISGMQCITFLGFAFLEQNMELIRGSAPSLTRVYATAYGFSDSDVSVIRGKIVTAFQTMPMLQNTQVQVKNDLKCTELLNSFSLSITQ